MKQPIMASHEELEKYQEKAAELKINLAEAGIWDTFEAWVNEQLEAGAPAGPMLSTINNSFAIAAAAVLAKYPPPENMSEAELEARLVQVFGQTFALECDEHRRARIAAQINKPRGLDS